MYYSLLLQTQKWVFQCSILVFTQNHQLDNNATLLDSPLASNSTQAKQPFTLVTLASIRENEIKIVSYDYTDQCQRLLTKEAKHKDVFSKPIIVVGSISGVHQGLIGLIRSWHDCITNSMRACQDGFISIPVVFLEKHLVISVW